MVMSLELPTVIAPFIVTDAGVVLAVALPMFTLPAEVIVFRTKFPGVAVESKVIFPDVVVEIVPEVWFMVLAVMLTLLAVPVIMSPFMVSVPVTFIVLPAPTSTVPAVTFIVVAERLLFCNVQVEPEPLKVAVAKLEPPVLMVFEPVPLKVTVELPQANAPATLLFVQFPATLIL